MEDQLITFKTAKLAKEKGFNEPCREYYNEDKEVQYFRYFTQDGNGWGKNSTMVKEDHYNDNPVCSAPTQSLLQKWLREVHKKQVNTFPYPDGRWEWLILFLDKPLKSSAFKNKMSLHTPPYFFSSHEKALEQGLQEALKLI